MRPSLGCLMKAHLENRSRHADFHETTDKFWNEYLSVYNFGGLGPIAKYQNDISTRYRNTNTLSYDMSGLFGNDAHTMNVLLGEEMTITRSNQVRMQSNDLPAFYDAEMAWNFMSSGNPTAVVNY